MNFISYLIHVLRFHHTGVKIPSWRTLPFDLILGTFITLSVVQWGFTLISDETDFSFFFLLPYFAQNEIVEQPSLPKKRFSSRFVRVAVLRLLAKMLLKELSVITLFL